MSEVVQVDFKKENEESMDIEKMMLRDFYTKWCALHVIPRDSLHRHKQELAAQNMVDCHHMLQNLYHPPKLVS